MNNGALKGTGYMGLGRCFSIGNNHASHPGALNGRYEHGMCGTPEYRAFNNAKQRCNNCSNPRYSDWGGRGIKFLLKNVVEMVNDIGDRPSRLHSLDRVDNNGHYEVGNIRWATKQQQRNNARQASSTPLRDSKTGRFYTQEIQSC